MYLVINLVGNVKTLLILPDLIIFEVTVMIVYQIINNMTVSNKKTMEQIYIYIIYITLDKNS